MTGTILLRVCDKPCGAQDCKYHSYAKGLLRSGDKDPTHLLIKTMKIAKWEPHQIDIRPVVKNWPDPENCSGERLRIEELK